MQIEYKASGGGLPPNVMLIRVESWVQSTFLYQALSLASSPTGGLVWNATEQFQAVEAGKNIVGGSGGRRELMLYINCTVIEKNVRWQNEAELASSWVMQLGDAEEGVGTRGQPPWGTALQKAVQNSLEIEKAFPEWAGC